MSSRPPRDPVAEVFGEESPDDRDEEQTESTVSKRIASAAFYLALAATLLTPLSLLAIHLDVQPWGNAALTAAIGGVTIAMIVSAVVHVIRTGNPA